MSMTIMSVQDQEADADRSRTRVMFLMVLATLHYLWKPGALPVIESINVTPRKVSSLQDWQE